jgi:hypothetical protein
MNIWLEEKIKEAILAVRWKQVGNGPNPNYFESISSDSLRMESETASFLAKFIAWHISNIIHEKQDDPADGELDRYSPEVLASYLEDQGYTVSSPD